MSLSKESCYLDQSLPVVRPVEYKAMTACTAMYRQGTSNVSNMICNMRSLLYFGFKGASVNRAGKSWDSTRSWSYV